MNIDSQTYLLNIVAQTKLTGGFNKATQANSDSNSPPLNQIQQSNPGSQSNSTLKPDIVSLSDQGVDKNSNENELSEDEQKEVKTLKDRDREVRVHEQAHAAVGGQYAGSPSYEFETGPDGKRYAVGGEVSIDVSEEENPEDTIQKMQIVRAAALAPAEPSTQDLKVAAEATQKESKARSEVGQSNLSADPESHDNQSKSDTNRLTKTQLANTYSSSISAISSFATRA